MVKMVEAELKIEVSEDISAANITANINPRKTTKKEIKIGNTGTIFFLDSTDLSSLIGNLDSGCPQCGN